MDFFLQNIKEVVESLNRLIERNIPLADTKKVRICAGIKSSNRSKINFIWRSLKYLNEHGFIDIDGAAGKYKLTRKTPFDVDKVVEYAKNHK
jgi:hypothetical protein